MRAISRSALGVATAAVLACTAAVPSVAQPQGDQPGKRQIVGSKAAAAKGKGGKQSTVTLVTGDKVLVGTDSSGRSAATVLPREDGFQPIVTTRQSGKDLFVYPEGAVEAIAAGKVDEQLFNVTGLVRQGYDDAHAKSLPLIATYDKSVDVSRSIPATLRGAERELVLDVIDGVALKADKKKAADFWADLTSPKSRAASDVKKLWLDAKVESTLDKSTKQVHAPEAWAAGYDGKGTKVAVLDTGVDADHPDLKGRIAASKNFTDSDTTDDRQGHGTHTTSTVGGSGAASDGKKKGVAPGADLLAGKVLNDSGEGDTSWIIAGMQWAVDNKADVVSMSLGSGLPTDCDDPMSTAAEEFARNSGTLFVVAAGNLGERIGDNSISSPGCTPGVLSVGAVDRENATAYFSSRGPAPTTHTLKPEITAPGVDISAANAGGRGVYAYQSMSGTSMATPHVAGAAAILKQRHPDWTPQQLKSALVSSANPDIPGDVRRSGGGLLDVKGAVDQTVLSAPALQGGTFNWPQDSSDRTTVEVPYTNTSDKAVRLDLGLAKFRGHDGSTIRSSLARLAKSSVTVPAGATVKVPLKLDPGTRLEPGQYGDITGRVIAKGAKGVHVSTPFSLYVQPETVTLRVKLIDRQGKPADGPSSLDVIGMDDAKGSRRFNEGENSLSYELRPGRYFLSGFVATPDAGEGASLYDSISYLGRPQVQLKKDTTITLDARKAHRLSIKTDEPSEPRGATLSFARTWDESGHGFTAQGPRSIRGYYASIEGDARDGEFEFGSTWRAAAPQISELKAEGGPVLHPTTASTGSANLDGTGSAELVDAKTGTPEELKAAGVKGKIALVKVPNDSTSLFAIARNAKAEGAKAVLAHRDAPGRWFPSMGFVGGELPGLAVQSAEAKALLAKLATGPVTLNWKATAKSPYVYNLFFAEDGAIHGDRTYKVRDSGLGKVESSYHAMGVGTDFLDLVSTTTPIGMSTFIGEIETVPSPGRRTEYYSAGATTWQHKLSSSFPWGEYMVDRPRSYQAGKTSNESWYDGVVTPSVPHDETGKELLAAERQGNLIGFEGTMWSDGGHDGIPGSFGDIGGLVLRRDGEQIGESGYPSGAFEVPAEEATYELEQRIEKIGSPAKVWQRSSAVQTIWKFRSKLDESQFSQGLGILFPRYTLPEDGLKTLEAKDGLKIGLTVKGHAGYAPGAIKSAKLSYSYDEGQTWTEAAISGSGKERTATVNHAGASGKQVWLKTELTDENGNSVTQTVVRAYDVR
ncbi:S8 family peptidase [Streptomyces sp. NBC_01304]|uniref:S8 family peptidase n=1 Tax=Streptomyces sp. NBC_01304 TaxID=2903818 RepID=UPI002E0DD28E|nr:S8 family serine peptidase [Streptomyces sp. NBC_01304]